MKMREESEPEEEPRPEPRTAREPEEEPEEPVDDDPEEPDYFAELVLDDEQIAEIKRLREARGGRHDRKQISRCPDTSHCTPPRTP